MAKRKTVESNTGPCPKRPAEHGGAGHLFQNPRNVPPLWCIYCDRLAIVEPDPRYVRRGSPGAKP
jgi:hypothetical protein